MRQRSFALMAKLLGAKPDPIVLSEIDLEILEGVMARAVFHTGPGFPADHVSDEEYYKFVLEWNRKHRNRPDETLSRVHCDEESRSVYIDGKLIAKSVGPTPFTFFKSIASGRGQYIRGSTILALPGMHGKKLDRDAFAKLPRKLQELVKSKKGSGGGYCLSLSPKCP